MGAIAPSSEHASPRRKVKAIFSEIFGIYNGGGARNFPTGAEPSDEGAKMWFSGYYKCQKSTKKSLFTFRRGTSMLRRGAIAP